ncbi:hypothetical protein DRN62_04005, partial [Nanoarchaeota archaeon]
MLEVIRETPKYMAKDSVFESALVIHNRGCVDTYSNITIVENLSAGWTPANPSLLGDVELISASVDLENNLITWVIAPLEVNKYVIATYQVKAPPVYPTTGYLKWNLSYDDFNFEEFDDFEVHTYNYTSESHLEYDLQVEQQSEYPWYEPRSVQPNKTYNFTLIVRNIGDVPAVGWNVSLPIPSSCNVTWTDGSWDEQSRIIEWTLPQIGVRETAELNFTLNCTKLGKMVFKPYGVRNTVNSTYYEDIVNYTCQGESCGKSITHTFQHPNKPYERMGWFAVYFLMNSSGYNVTVSQYRINTTNDFGDTFVVYGGHFFSAVNINHSINYSIPEYDQWSFRNTDRLFGLYSEASATYNPNTTLNLTKIAYIWNYGKLFNETQDLFAKVKVYSYVPLLENATLLIDGNSSETVGGWGEEFNFTVMVRDRFGRNVTVYAWHRKVGETWQLINYSLCEDCLQWTQMNFTYDYQPQNISTWEFKFNASNEDGNSEIYGHTYTVEKDDVQVTNIIPVQDAIVNRSSSSTFSIRIYDTDNESYPDGTTGKIFISIFDVDTFESSPPILSSTNGWINRTMSNSDWCSDETKYYLGVHSWYGATSGDPYIKDNESAKTNFTLMGELTANLLSPDGSMNYTRDDQYNYLIQFNGTVFDDCGNQKTDVNNFPVYFKVQNGNYVQTFTATTSGNYYVYTWNPDESAPLGWYNVTMIATHAGGKYWNGTFFLENAFFLASIPQLDNPQASPNPGGWGESPFNFTVNVTNVDNTTTTIYLWLKNSTVDWYIENYTTCSYCSNFTYFYQKNFTKYNIDTWYFRFNATSESGVYQNTSDLILIVERDDLSINLSSGDGISVNRSDSRPNNTVRLVTQAWDLDLSNYTTDIDLNNFHSYVWNGSSWLEEQENKNETHFYLDFNPNCSYEAGNQSWKMNVNNALYYKNATSNVFSILIYGDLNNTYLSPINETFVVGTLITLKGEIYDDCGAPVIGASVRFELKSGSFTDYCPSSGWVTNTSGNLYVCQWDSSSAVAGVYNVTMFSNKSYFNNGTTIYSYAFNLTKVPELKYADVTPDSGGWSRTFNFT